MLVSLPAGLTPAIVGSAVAWGTYFYLYEAAKEAHQKWLGVERLGPGWNYLSAAEAGGAVSDEAAFLMSLFIVVAQ